MNGFPRIVFFGTPEFAVASLERLVCEGFLVAGVVTAPDKPSGRGLKAHEPAVKVFACKHGIPVLQPVSMKDPAFLEQLAALRPDLQIVIAFRMMPEAVWSLPPLGTFNLHASLLPQYRGAAPINRAVMNGETETGVTTFFLNRQIDTGTIILAEKTMIGPDETAGDLHDRLMTMGAETVIRTVEMIVRGGFVPVSQETMIAGQGALKQAPKIFREDCRINWDQEVEPIRNFIRGLSPHPGAFTEITMPGGEKTIMKIFRVSAEPGIAEEACGKFYSDGKSWLKVGAKNGFIQIEELQAAGRKVMKIGDFLRGSGWIFTETYGI